MAFSYSLNLTVPDVQTAIYQMKQLMVAAGWQVVGSGDGGGLFNATGDCLTGSSTGPGYVAGSITNAFAYCILQAPGTQTQLLISHSGTNGDANIAIGFSDTTAFGTQFVALSTDIYEIDNSTALAFGDALYPGHDGVNFGGLSTALTWDFIMGDSAELFAFSCLGRVPGGTGEYVGGFIYDRMKIVADGENSLACLIPVANGSDGITTTPPFSNRIFDYAVPGWVTVPNPSTNGYLLSGLPYARAIVPYFAQFAGPSRVANTNEQYLNAATQHIPRICDALNTDTLLGVGVDGAGNMQLISPVVWATAGGPAAGPIFGGITVPGRVQGQSVFFLAISGDAGVSPMDTTPDLGMIYQPGGYWLRWDGATPPII